EGFAQRRDVGPEDAGPETETVEPAGDAADRAALPDQTEFQQTVRHDHHAHGDSQHQHGKIEVHRTTLLRARRQYRVTPMVSAGPPRWPGRGPRAARARP